MFERVEMGIILDTQIIDDKFLAVHSVLAHIELEQLVDGILFAQGHTVDPHVGAYEASELLGRDLAQTLEPGDLGIVAELIDGIDALLIGVAVVSGANLHREHRNDRLANTSLG